MTRIECGNCGNVSEVEARTIMLPFYCTECKEAAEFQANIAPAAAERLAVAIQEYSDYKGISEVLGLDKACQQGQQEHPGLDESLATVENTTLLIADLEQQVSLLEKSQQDSSTLIADMGAQLQEDATVLGDRDQTIASLKKSYSELYAMQFDEHQLNEKLQQNMDTLLTRIAALRNGFEKQGIKHFNENLHAAEFAGRMLTLADEWDATQEELETEIRGLKNRLALSEEENSSLSDRVGALMTDRDYWMRRGKDWRNSAAELIKEKYSILNRGLFARIFNVGA